jgi:hypothetical protein
MIVRIYNYFYKGAIVLIHVALLLPLLTLLLQKGNHKEESRQSLGKRKRGHRTGSRYWSLLHQEKEK